MEKAKIFDIDELRKKRLAKLNARAQWLDLIAQSNREIQILTETIRAAEVQFEPYERFMPSDYIEDGIG